MTLLDVILLSSCCEGNPWGEEVFRLARNIGGVMIRRSTMYVTLRRLEVRGFVRKTRGSAGERGGLRRRHFATTDTGRAELARFFDLAMRAQTVYSSQLSVRMKALRTRQREP